MALAVSGAAQDLVARRGASTVRVSCAPGREQSYLESRAALASRPKSAWQERSQTSAWPAAQGASLASPAAQEAKRASALHLQAAILDRQASGWADRARTERLEN